MTSIWYYLLLFSVGLISSIINVNAGGGSALTLPALIFIGMDSAMANGTNRIGILLQNLIAVTSFRQQQVSRFKESLVLSLVTLPGGIIGALAAIKINNVWFQRILAVVMIGIVLTMFIPNVKHDESAAFLSGKRKWWSFLALFGIGFYGGFIQVGVGFLLMAVLYHILRMNLVFVNMHKVFIVLVFTIPALFIFGFTGNINWGYGLSLAAGSSIGAWLGVKIAVKGGEKAIRIILAVAILMMAVKLLGGF
jgi:uncharacterized membrane protein YfcA